MTASHLRVATVEDLGRVVHEASAARTRLRLVAGGSWLDAGHRVTADASLDLSALSGIVAYVPGDFTMTARASTTLAEIEAAAQAHGQYLHLDPHGSSSGTLGATLATASSGSLASTAGTPRDVTLGITFVDGSGAVIQAGGRVVKNVAGFDLVRLAIGAWGTLGIIVEASVRLRAIPPSDVTVALPVPPQPAELESRLRALANADVQPLAAELLTAALARQLGLADSDVLLVRIAGNRSVVRAQRDTLHRLAVGQEVPSDIWASLTRAESSDARVLRISTDTTAVAGVWCEVCGRMGTAVLAHAGVQRGSIRVLAGTDVDQQTQALLDHPPSNARVRGERLPASWWPPLSPRLSHRLAVGVRRAFDPHGILNPGILGTEPA